MIQQRWFHFTAVSTSIVSIFVNTYGSVTPYTNLTHNHFYTISVSEYNSEDYKVP